jgi:hypothetical protein
MATYPDDDFEKTLATIARLRDRARSFGDSARAARYAAAVELLLAAGASQRGGVRPPAVGADRASRNEPETSQP